MDDQVDHMVTPFIELAVVKIPGKGIKGQEPGLAKLPHVLNA